jgi:hypothetical protein
MGRIARALLVAAWAAAACGHGPPASTGPADAPTADAPDAPDAAAPRAVLFVGNSYTYYFDLPVEVAALAPPAAPLATTSVTVGGATLGDHWAGAAKDAIAAGGHAVVVLQGQSQEPLLDAAGFAASADLLTGAAASAGAEVAFYQTWARRAGDPFYAVPASGGTPAAMQDGLTAGYAAAATRNHAAVAPVGEARRLALAEAPTLELFDPDGSHPSAAGAYLAAAVLVETLTGQPPTDAPRLGLDAATRATLRDVAHRAVRATAP